MGLSFFLVFSLFLTIGSSIRVVPQSSCHRNVEGAHHRNSSSIHLPLHHPRSPCSPAPRPELTVSDILRHDDVRVAALASRITKSGIAISSSSVSEPLIPGAVVHTGNYVTKIGLGTPSVDYVMEVDTGSSFSWVQCAPCKIFCHQQVGTIFNPNSSSSYSTVPCSAAECGELLEATLNPSLCTVDGNVCGYEASYGDNSSSTGYLSKETLSLGSAGSSSTIPGFIFGCGQDNGDRHFGQSAGLVGLDTDKLSLISQVSPSLGSSFAYCLPSPTSIGHLSIGSYDSSNVAFTPMLPNSKSSLYSLQLSGISVAGTTLPVPASSYTSLPTIIDSGTVITHLPSDVYTAFSKAIVGALGNVTPAPAFSILDTCFEGSLTSLPVLEVKVAFGTGVELSLPMENVFFDIPNPNSTCLAFMAETLGVTIIGNRLQQSFTVVYDIGASKIGFGPGDC